MSMTDPVADLLTRIRNASKARHQKTDVPWSRLKEQIVRVLGEEGYVRDYVVSGEGPGKTLTVVMRYTAEGEPVITGIKRTSKPGLRVYASAAEAPVVRGGLGVSILSTPSGVVADREARRRNVGGEVLCEVW
jgi:small subunit ribosomal protein S8